jgi:hypothetical protein
MVSWETFVHAQSKPNTLYIPPCPIKVIKVIFNIFILKVSWETFVHAQSEPNTLFIFQPHSPPLTGCGVGPIRQQGLRDDQVILHYSGCCS